MVIKIYRKMNLLLLLPLQQHHAQRRGRCQEDRPPGLAGGAGRGERRRHGAGEGEDRGGEAQVRILELIRINFELMPS